MAGNLNWKWNATHPIGTEYRFYDIYAPVLGPDQPHRLGTFLYDDAKEPKGSCTTSSGCKSAKGKCTRHSNVPGCNPAFAGDKTIVNLVNSFIADGTWIMG